MNKVQYALFMVTGFARILMPRIVKLHLCHSRNEAIAGRLPHLFFLNLLYLLSVPDSLQFDQIALKAGLW
jgi:hypothetical protein